jgi:hypothetical protein
MHLPEKAEPYDPADIQSRRASVNIFSAAQILTVRDEAFAHFTAYDSLGAVEGARGVQNFYGADLVTSFER